MARSSCSRVRFGSALSMLAAVAVLLSACASGSDDEAGGETDEAPLGADQSDVAGDDGGDDGAADESDDPVSGEFRAEVDNSGPVGTELVLPGESGYLDALGLDAVRVTRVSPDRTEVTDFDRSGNAYGAVTYGDGTIRESWLIDGEIYEVLDGKLLPAMYGEGLIDQYAGLSVFIDEEILNLLAPGGEVSDEDGNPRREHKADPAAVLAYHVESFPDNWEWQVAELTSLATPGGGMLQLEQRQMYTVSAPNDTVDPRPPREVEAVITYTVEPVTEPVIVPTDTLHPDADRHRATEILRRAAVIYDNALTNAFFDEEHTGLISLELMQANAARIESPVSRFVDEYVDFENVGPRTIGYAEDGVLVLRAESGLWHCIAGRLTLADPSTQEINEDGTFGERVYFEASGEALDDVALDCRQQRTNWTGF